MVYDYDVVVIGAGPGGYVAAIAAAQKKLKVACVDKNVALGGTCLNVGCIPSKILLHISHFYEEAHINAEKYGMSFAGLSYDWSKIQKIKQDRISELNKGITALFKKNGVTFFNGEASFVNANKIKVGQAEITADKFIIASGSSPSSLPNIEIDEEKIVSSTGALSLKTVPENLVIIGAGYIGLELGSVYAKLGSKVKVIEFADKVTPAMDAEISISFKKILEQQGIEFYMQHKVLSAVATKNDVAVVSESLEGGKKIEFKADIALVSVGRKPNTQNMKLENVKVKVDSKGFIEVNNKLQTNIQNIYAIGDVIGGAMLAHKAEEEAMAAVATICGEYAHVNYNNIPGVVYTSPEVACIGQTEEQLKKLNIAYKIGKFPFIANSRAKAVGETSGFVKILACDTTDKILGCHIIGKDAGNLIHEVAVIMEFGGNSEDLSMICHAHPTLNEAIKEAALAVKKRAIHI